MTEVGGGMEQEVEREIEEIMEGMECAKDFECYRSGFKRLCKARDDGLKEHVWCMEEADVSRGCGYSLSFGDGMLCKCPLRVYLAKKLRI
ncbi:MAG: hypothetical protein ACYTE5_07390 [Planctomycetota bacterium]